jgi:hypothetical protein
MIEILFHAKSDVPDKAISLCVTIFEMFSIESISQMFIINAYSEGPGLNPGHCLS